MLTYGLGTRYLQGYVMLTVGDKCVKVLPG